jgi:hypothetical protein
MITTIIAILAAVVGASADFVVGVGAERTRSADMLANSIAGRR